MSQNLTEVSGYLGTATINNGSGAVEIPVRDWTISSTIRLSPDTNSMSGPYPLQLGSYLGDVFSATISRNFYTGSSPYAIGVSRGTVISQIFAYEYQTARGNLGTGGAAHTLTSLVVQSVNSTMPVASGANEPVRFTAIVTGPLGSYTPPPT